MGGSGGGGSFTSSSPENLAEQVRKAEDATSVAAFESTLSGMLDDLLVGYNDRDYKLVTDRLADAMDAFDSSIDGSVDQLYGGSVAKHTYVDGFSDVDSLVFLNDTELEEHSPQQALDHMVDTLRDRLETDVVISKGQMAVTLEYVDGMQIQLLPAIKDEGGTLHVPSSRRDGWSHIDPEPFRQALTRRNVECGRKLIPTIKLAKAINANLPESQQLSGYHMESLAVAAFRGFEGKKTTAAMLPHFFERAKELVLTPMRDSTGQSVHVDAYLGDANSERRVASSHVLDRLSKRMRNATAGGSLKQWGLLFGDDG